MLCLAKYEYKLNVNVVDIVVKMVGYDLPSMLQFKFHRIKDFFVELQWLTPAVLTSAMNQGPCNAPPDYVLLFVYLRI